jgi:hypothetical protein
MPRERLKQLELKVRGVGYIADLVTLIGGTGGIASFFDIDRFVLQKEESFAITIGVIKTTN